MQLILLLFTLVLFIAGLYCLDCPYREVVDYLQCKVCSTPELSGSISDDSCCNYETVDKTLEAHFYPILQKLVKVPFFRYFKVNLNKPCPFWSDDDGMCSNRECSVCECDESEVPRSWLNMKERPLVDLEERPCAEQIGQDFESRVEQVSKGEMDSTFNPWDQHKDDNIWIDQSEDNENEDMVYVNLLDNPEKFTGYSGRLAEKVWHAIYDENCFDTGDDEKCLEERVFYRLISGMQSSINTHIAAEYNGEHNVQLYVDRVGKHPERLQNLYFTYLFVIRAVSRARSLLLNYDYSTGIEKDEEQTIKWMKELIQEEDSPLPSDEAQSSAWSVEQKAVLAGFDENRLFAVNTKNMTLVEAIGAKKEQQVLEDQFRAKFQNISRIMDCGKKKSFMHFKLA